MKKQSQSLDLVVIALVALVAIVGLVALVMNAQTTTLASGSRMVSANSVAVNDFLPIVDQNTAGDGSATGTGSIRVTG